MALEDLGERLDESDPVPERDHVPDGEDHRDLGAHADQVPPGLGRPGSDPVRVDTDRDRDQPAPATLVPLVDVLLHVGVHHHDAGSVATEPGSDHRRVEATEHRVVLRDRVLEAGVHAEQRGDPSAARVRAGRPRQVHELTVLVDDVGLEVVQQSPQPPSESGPGGEGEIERDRESRLGQHHGRHPDDADAVAHLLRGRILVGGRHHEDVVPSGRVPPRERVTQVRTSSDPRRVEVVHHDDAHADQAPARTVALTAATMRSRSPSLSEGWTGSEITSRATCWVTGSSSPSAKRWSDCSWWFGIG